MNTGCALVAGVQACALPRSDADTWLAGHTAGSGPFELVSLTKGQSLVMQRNPHYAGPKNPVLDKFVTKIVPEASARRLQLQRGDLDTAADLTVTQLQEIGRA